MRWFNNRTIATHGSDNFSHVELQETSLVSTRISSRHLEGTAAVLVEQANCLWDNIRNNDPIDLLPSVVGGISRIQELTNDLLAKLRGAEAIASSEMHT